MATYQLTETEQRNLHRLQTETPFFARHCCTIVNKQGQRQLLVAKSEQLRFDKLLEAQEAQGLPMRGIILKARQIGFSTWVQAKLIQRATQRMDHRAMVIAQDRQTVGELFDRGKMMWEHMPDPPEAPGFKPKLTGRAKQRLLEFSNGSYYRADGAKEFEAGRGLTINDIHISELAMWQDIRRKLISLLNAVPDGPGTMVVIEFTANGHNEAKDIWDAAVAGENGYAPFFSPWFEEPGYSKPFANDSERQEFIEDIGEGPYGEDEPLLMEMGVSPEQLQWRRWKITGLPFNGDLDRFKQEYPATPDEAFLSTGKTVFAAHLIQRTVREVSEAPKPETGFLKPEKVVWVERRGVKVPIPSKATWEPGGVSERKPGWLVWEHPTQKTDESPAGQYVIGVDASGGDEENVGTAAYHAIEVIDHKTKVQVAEYRSQIDPDLLAEQIYLACLYYNRAWVAVEITGSWGQPANRRLHFDYRHPFVYRRRNVQSAHERLEDRLGWHTGAGTKHVLEEYAGELLREGSHGIRSVGLAGELPSYVRDSRGRSGPEPGKFSDRLLAWMIAQQIAREKPLRPERKSGDVTSTIRNANWNEKTGYVR